jgi:phosphate transport system substrate-binding protein
MNSFSRYTPHPIWKLSRQVVLLAALALLAACGARSTAGGVNISGSTSVSPFVEHLAEVYKREHAGTLINVQSLGSSAGIQAAINGTANIGMSSRDLSEEEAAQLDQLIIARDALAVIVHPSNPLTGLSLAQIQAIFSGEIASWKELGGQDQPITLIVREAGSGTYGAFEELVMKGAPISTAALRQGSNGAIRQLVSLDPNAVGYISLGIVDATVKALPIDTVQPSVEHVEDGTYSFVRPFLFVWPKGQAPAPEAASFIDYVMSDVGQEELLRLGLVPAADE